MTEDDDGLEPLELETILGGGDSDDPEGEPLLGIETDYDVRGDQSAETKDR
jgi:hypothetical protein